MAQLELLEKHVRIDKGAVGHDLGREHPSKCGALRGLEELLGNEPSSRGDVRDGCDLAQVVFLPVYVCQSIASRGETRAAFVMGLK